MRGQDKVLEGTVAGIVELIRSGKYKKDDVYPILEKVQELYGNKDIAVDLIKKIKAEYRRKHPKPLFPA